MEAKKRHFVSSYFYTELSPYGTWVEIDYGVVVWRPTVMRMGWAPYRMGSWVWTYDGWYWDSYESFGYITYHYGRWYYDDYYGWLWYPDYEWAPAWVEWRYDDDYIGWAPLHPYATFSINLGIFFTTAYYTPYNHWQYVNYGNFCDPYVYNYYVEDQYKYRIHSNTKYRTNYSYNDGRVQNRGVDVKHVRTRSGQDIRERDIVRVRDSKEINRNGYANRNEIRTLDVSKDQLARTEDRKMNIKQDKRKTSVDLSKVQVGERNRITTSSRDNGSVDKITKKNDVNNVQKDNVRKVEDQKVVNRKNLDNNRNVPVEKNGKVITNDQNRTKSKNNNVDRTGQVNNQKKNNVDQRKEIVTNKNQQVDRNQNTQTQRTEVKKDNRNQNNVKQNTQKQRTEVKKDNRNQNTVKQNTQTQRTEVKKDNSNQNVKREGNNNREVTRNNDQQKNTNVTRDKKVEDNKKEEDSKQKSRR